MSDEFQTVDETGTQLYTPQVVEQRKPNVKQEFQSLDEAFQFYNSYARECGFSARMSTSKRKKGTNELIYKQFVCFKEGETNEHYQKKEKHTVQRSCERNRGLVRVGCKAKMSVVKSQTGPNWIVSQFVEEHNHALSTPSKIHLLRSHRVVSAAKRVLSQQLSEANIPMCQQIRVLEIEAGGPQNIGCVEKDIRNYGQRVRDDQKDNDAELLIEFFSSEEEKNPAFYFKYELDEESRLVRCFWADPFARRSYHFFGDVVVFDTTYNTNKYDMIFAPLAGVNHHGQTVIFGCALLSGEKTESFIWLFNQLLDAMPRGAPQVIITDQDPAMTKAIAQVLPSTCHRYCMWHILKKFSEKMNAIVYRDNYHWFKNIIFNSETVEEFETSWVELMKNIHVEDNAWLRQMYEIRNKWVPVYFNHIFNAGMLSSQRAESSHAFFKRYISNKNSLMDFIVRFNRAVNHQRHDELVADHNDVNEQPKLKTMCPMETQMLKIYTKRNFIIFQDELFESSAYFLSCTFEDGESMLYTVQKAGGSCSSKSRQLKYNKFSDFVSCSCRLFDFNGIPCRHILAYFRIKQVMFLPSEYILRRWTKSAKIDEVWDNNGQEMNDEHDMSLVTRHASLSRSCSTLVDDASLTVEGTKFLLNEIELLRGKIKEMNGDGILVPETNSKRSTKELPSINNPSHVRSKGCGKRLKSPKEMLISKSRLCRGCGLRGQQHDKRNCPRLQERSTMYDQDINSHSSSEDDDLTSHAGSNLHSAKRS